MTEALVFNRLRHLLIILLCLTHALWLFPAHASENSAQIHFFHALKSKQEGDLLAAEILLKRAVEMEPENADYHFELGNLYVERGNLVGARMELEQAVMISPAHQAAHYNLGLVYRELGFMSEARNQFRRVLEINPRHVKAQLQIGYTYEEEGFLDEARQAFETAQDMDITDPEPARALEDLIQVERELKERSRREAEASFQRNQSLGAQLIQQLMARRAQTSSENEN